MVAPPVLLATELMTLLALLILDKVLVILRLKQATSFVFIPFDGMLSVMMENFPSLVSHVFVGQVCMKAGRNSRVDIDRPILD